MHSAGLVSCSLNRRIVTLWICAESPRLLGARQFIPAVSECNEARLKRKHELSATFCRDSELGWSRRALDMEHAATGDSGKVYYFIRASSKKVLDGSETICRAHSSTVCKQQRGPVCWENQFQV